MVYLGKTTTITHKNLHKDRHTAVLNDRPSTLIERSNKSIRARCTVMMQLLNHSPNFLLREDCVKILKISHVHPKEIQVEGVISSVCSPNQIVIGLQEDMFHSTLIRDDLLSQLVVWDEIFALLPLEIAWKNLVLASPSFNHLNIDLCLSIVHSKDAKPRRESLRVRLSQFSSFKVVFGQGPCLAGK